MTKLSETQTQTIRLRNGGGGWYEVSADGEPVGAVFRDQTGWSGYHDPTDTRLSSFATRKEALDALLTTGVTNG